MSFEFGTTSFRFHMTPLDRPLVEPTPLPILEAPRVPDAPDEELVSCAVVPPRTVDDLARVRAPLSLIAPRVPRAVPDAAACLRSVSVSRFLRSSSRLSSSSAALRSAARCLRRASASCSARSSVAPLQPGFSISRWLCSVCESIRVQLFKRIEALWTDFKTT